MRHNSKKNSISTPLSESLSNASGDSLANPVPAGNIPRLDTLPDSAYRVIDLYRPVFGKPVRMPLFGSLIAAGFPSPADDFVDTQVDLYDLFCPTHRHATFFGRVKGDSMNGCGIMDKAFLVINRSRKPKSGDVVLAVLEGEFTCKRLQIENGKVYLCPENPSYKPLRITEQMQFMVWGVVTSASNFY